VDVHRAEMLRLQAFVVCSMLERLCSLFVNR